MSFLGGFQDFLALFLSTFISIDMCSKWLLWPVAEGEAGYGYPPDEVKHHIRFHWGSSELLSGLLLSTLDSFLSNVSLSLSRLLSFSKQHGRDLATQCLAISVLDNYTTRAQLRRVPYFLLNQLKFEIVFLWCDISPILMFPFCIVFMTGTTWSIFGQSREASQVKVEVQKQKISSTNDPRHTHRAEVRSANSHYKVAKKLKNQKSVF